MCLEEGVNFGSCSAWKGENDLPRGRKGLPGGPRAEGNYAE